MERSLFPGSKKQMRLASYHGNGLYSSELKNQRKQMAGRHLHPVASDQHQDRHVHYRSDGDSHFNLLDGAAFCQKMV